MLLLLLASLLGAVAPMAPAPNAPRIDWPRFFARVSVRGVEFSEELRALEGRRVVLRGFSVSNPPVAGGVLLTRYPYSDPHEVGESDVPYDAVGVLWRKGLSVPPVPPRPTVEGTLRLGNRTLGAVVVTITLEDAVPVYPKVPGALRLGGGSSQTGGAWRPSSGL